MRGEFWPTWADNGVAGWNTVIDRYEYFIRAALRSQRCYWWMNFLLVQSLKLRCFGNAKYFNLLTLGHSIAHEPLWLPAVPLSQPVMDRTVLNGHFSLLVLWLELVVSILLTTKMACVWEMRWSLWFFASLSIIIIILLSWLLLPLSLSLLFSFSALFH